MTCPADFPELAPTHTICGRLLWTALVEIGEREALGASPLGERFLVPILGGCFWPGPDVEGLEGVVIPGGADRQLLRADGVKELEAIYDMRANDGTLITIRNQVIVDQDRMPDRYAMSVIRATTASGPHAWVNRRLIVGTLQSLRPGKPFVAVRAFAVDQVPTFS